MDDNVFEVLSINKKCMCISLDRQSKALVDLYIRSMQNYDEQINILKEKIKFEKRNLTSTIASKLETVDGVDEYKHLGAKVVCEGFAFIYGADEKFHYME